MVVQLPLATRCRQLSTNVVDVIAPVETTSPVPKKKIRGSYQKNNGPIPTFAA